MNKSQISSIIQNAKKPSEIDLMDSISIRTDIQYDLENSLSTQLLSGTEFEIIKCKIREIIYGNQAPDQLKKNEIGKLINTLQEMLSTIDEEKKGMFLKLIEELMFMFIFHFDIEINNFGFILLKSIIDITKFDYHKELLINIIKIIQILNVKRNIQNASSTILYIIISNCSSCLSVILNFVNPEVKKIMYDFLKKNVTDYTLIYLLLINCNKDFNYSKVFSSEQVYDILDKYKTELEKKYFFLEKMLNSNKFDNTLSSKLQIKQIIDTLGAICKILDSFIYRGHRTYNVDKIIKNLIPLCQKIIILLSTKINDIDYNLSTESIQNILFFFQATNCLDTEKVLLLLHWNQKFLESNLKYFINTDLIIECLINCTITEQTFSPSKTKIENICQIILQVIENTLISVNSQPENNMINAILYKMLQNILKIKPDFIIDVNLYPKCYDYFKKNTLKSVIIFSSNNDYCNTKYNNSIKLEEQNENNYFVDCLNKFELFKNSIKTCYNLQGTTLKFEKKFDLFKEKVNKNKYKVEDYEVFFRNCSNEMFTEIFNKV